MLCSFLYQRLKAFTKALVLPTEEKEWKPDKEEDEQKLKTAITNDVRSHFPGQEAKIDDQMKNPRFFYNPNNIIHRCERWEDTLRSNRLD